MYCKKCGSELKEGTAFCPKCGCRVSMPLDNCVSDLVSNASSISERAIKTSGKGIRTLLIVIACLVIFAGAGTVAAKNVVSSPERTVKNMIEAFNDADIKSMLKCYSPKTNSQYEGAMGVMGMFGIDGEAIVGMASAYADTPNLKVKVKDIIYYKSGEPLGSKIPEIFANASADRAVITVELYEDGEYWDTRTFELKNYKKDGWLIEEDIFGM